MNLQKVFKQQIIMHSFSYNFRHLHTRQGNVSTKERYSKEQALKTKTKIIMKHNPPQGPQTQWSRNALTFLSIDIRWRKNVKNSQKKINFTTIQLNRKGTIPIKKKGTIFSLQMLKGRKKVWLCSGGNKDWSFFSLIKIKKYSSYFSYQEHISIGSFKNELLWQYVFL